MDLSKVGKLILNLRKEKQMTQKQLADLMNISDKTVSKWERGIGCPDVSLLSELAKALDVNIEKILGGSLDKNCEETGNMKKTKFYVCPDCKSISFVSGESEISCCGRRLTALEAKSAENGHSLDIYEDGEEWYITVGHEMTKEHYICFIAYVGIDRVLEVRLYPEQDGEIRIPKMYGGKFYFYCNKHGLFVCGNGKNKDGAFGKQNKESLTAIMSAFARAYHFENSSKPIFDDDIAKKLIGEKEYSMIERYLAEGIGFFDKNKKNKFKSKDETINWIVETQLAPTPAARARFCEDALRTAVKTGTEQYVILGAGLDTFALRKNDFSKNTDIFELDYPSVQSDKIARLKKSGLEIPKNLHFVPADFNNDDLKSVLVQNGFDESKKTFFSWLGVSYYLPKNGAESIFESISSFASKGSEIVFDFADNHLFSSSVERVRTMLEMAKAGGEPMKSCFSYGELERLLEKYNFLIYEFLNTEDIQNRYFKDRDDNMSAFEHINYAHAVLK